MCHTLAATSLRGGKAHIRERAPSKNAGDQSTCQKHTLIWEQILCRHWWWFVAIHHLDPLIHNRPSLTISTCSQGACTSHSFASLPLHLNWADDLLLVVLVEVGEVIFWPRLPPPGCSCIIRPSVPFVRGWKSLHDASHSASMV